MTEELRFGAIARPRTFLNVVLDKSDSMDEIRDATIQAFNTFLQSQRGHRVDELFVTLTTFGSANDIREVYHAVPVAEVRPLTPGSYVPSGMTALYDAIASACAQTDRSVGRGDRVVICVITDGDENASREVRDLQHLLAIKKEYEARGNWTFTFLAAGADAYRAGQDLQIPPGNLRTYTADENGVSSALVTVDQHLRAYRQGDDLQTDTFFNPARYHPRPNWASTPVVLTDQDDG